MYRVALTTYDNPYNPIDEYDLWLAEDMRLARLKDRQETSRLRARLTYSSPELSDADQLIAEETAIDEIVSFDPKTYKKVTKNYD